MAKISPNAGSICLKAIFLVKGNARWERQKVKDLKTFHLLPFSFTFKT